MSFSTSKTEIEVLSSNYMVKLLCSEIAQLSSGVVTDMHEFQREELEFVGNKPRKESASSSGEEKILDEEDHNLSNLPFIPEATGVRKGQISNSLCDNHLLSNEVCTWSNVLKEAKELVCLHGKPSSSLSHVAASEARKFQKGTRGKSKFRFAIRSQSYKEEISWPSFRDEIGKPSEVPEVGPQLEPLDHRSLESSIAELLEGLQEKNGPLLSSSNTDGKTKAIKSQLAGKRSVAHLGNRFLDNEDPLEPMDSGTSSGDEATEANRNSGFTIRPQSYKEEISLPSFRNENEKPSKVPEVGVRFEGLDHRSSESSIAVLLEGLQEKNGPLPWTSNMDGKVKAIRSRLAGKKYVAHLGNRFLDNEDPLEPMDGGTSSGDEGSSQNRSNCATPRIKDQTMADFFQEAFSVAAVDGDGSLFPINKQRGSGYYGRLQQIMQTEKYRHVEFLKQLQTESCSLDELRSINVQILSRYLEAKLTVCYCSVDEKIKRSQCTENHVNFVDDGGNIHRTIIFSSRICGNVELEIGKLIRIHPPWKEVQVKDDEKIILCTYFSQILT